MTTTIAGTTGCNLVTDGSITPVKTQVGAVPSMIRLNTANGYGSTNTVVRRFTTTVISQGTDITYTDSAVNGATFTINTNGTYAISFTDSATAATDIAISLNSNQLTTAPASITASTRLVLGTTASANQRTNVAVTLFLSSGDVIRAITNGAAVGTFPDNTQFTIVRVA